MADSASPKRVLILDGNADFVAAATRFVKRLPGCTLVAADVVLLDIGLAGLELARRLKAGNPSLAVMGLALFPTPELVAQARLAGIDALISKESFADELPNALREIGLGR
jgi:DNA-binding NarL/FixJ family response regulator